MTTRGDRENIDPDDWFGEPPVPDPWGAEGVDDARGRGTASVEDWTSGDGKPEAIDRTRGVRLTWQVIAVAGLALAALLGVLAAAGVFSGGRHATLPPASPTTRPAATTDTTPTSRQHESPVLPTVPLKPGSSGAEVRKLQHALALAGVSPGAIDGQYGSATTRAVTRFQQAHGLAADGIAGPKTLAALKSALQTG